MKPLKIGILWVMQKDKALFWPDKQQLVQPGLLLLNIINVLINTEFSFLKRVLLFKGVFHSLQ